MADKPKKNDGKGTAVGNALRWLAKNGTEIAPDILELAGNITGIGALEKLADKISGSKDFTPEDKELLLAQLEYDKIKEQEITKRWEADLHSDSYLSKNIRPMVLGFLMFCMFVFIILDSSIKGFEIKVEWISLLSSLLMTAVGGYFVVRSGEKIMNVFKRR